MQSGLNVIAQDVNEHIHKHGWTIEFDIENNANSELLETAVTLINGGNGAYPAYWHHQYVLKITQARRVKQLSVAAALIVREINRIEFETFGDQPTTDEPVTIIDTKEFLLIRQKAERWDKLDEEIGKCYGDYDENNEEMKSEYEEEHGSEPDLITIGEIAATAYGYIKKKHLVSTDSLILSAN